MPDENGKSWKVCPCGTEMVPGSACKFSHVHLVGGPEDKDDSYVERLRYDGSWSRVEGGPCPDCNAGVGEYHHAECDTEKCPSCGDQMLGCHCWDTFVTVGEEPSC